MVLALQLMVTNRQQVLTALVWRIEWLHRPELVESIERVASLDVVSVMSFRPSVPFSFLRHATSPTIPKHKHVGHTPIHHPPSMPGHPHGPLVLTLILDAHTQHALNALRTKYFPPSRNHLGAHVTLFHAIPPHRLEQLQGHLNELCSHDTDADSTSASSAKAEQQASQAPGAPAAGQLRGAAPKGGFDVRFVKPQKMGNRGVMLNMQQKPSGSVQRIHRELLKRLKAGVEGEKDRLTNQDLMKLVHPHVTVLNKVDEREKIEQCLKELEGTEIAGKALGIEL